MLFLDAVLRLHLLPNLAAHQGPLLDCSYLDGLRDGPVEVFDETGGRIQKALYKNNLLVDSVKSFYGTGTTKNETMFVKGKPDGMVREYYPSGKVKKERRDRTTRHKSLPAGFALS